MKLYLILFLIILFFLSSCKENLPTPECHDIDPLYCETDEDCVCMELGCFLGGKLYWDKCVDKSGLCTDICPQDCNCVRNKCNCTSYEYA